MNPWIQVAVSKFDLTCRHTVANPIGANHTMAVFAEIPLVKQIGFTAKEFAVFEKYVIVEKFDKKKKILNFGISEKKNHISGLYKRG